jgi:hypothetical protein
MTIRQTLARLAWLALGVAALAITYGGLHMPQDGVWSKHPAQAATGSHANTLQDNCAAMLSTIGDCAPTATVTLPQCANDEWDEFTDPCVWDATRQGNGLGESFIVGRSDDGDATVTYVPNDSVAVDAVHNGL